MIPKLPIDSFLSAISAGLAENKNIVLVAEPGSGKTTRVAPYLLDEEWLKGKKILMLEPRRIAAKAAASFIALQRSEQVGATFGYRIRGESKVSQKTRLEVLTEGLLTRIVQSDPELDGIGLVIFDEFHERSIHADLALALVLEVQRALRPDLRIMIMSATLNADQVAALVDRAEVINCPGRQHPVEIRYGNPLQLRAIDSAVAEAIKKAHREEQGDILVFLPGRAEIRRVAEKLRASQFGSTSILALHSDIKGEEQNNILNPSDGDARRIILSTNVAETSVTIPRVRVVVDCGLARVPRFNVRRGVSGLETVAISRASAEQRSGRAGRQSAGVCYRLWSEKDEREMAAFNQPEIVYADLTPFMLELAAWGCAEPKRLSFMTQPPAAHVGQALQVLQAIGAVDEHKRITAHGRELLKFSLSPRLAHMLLVADRIGCGPKACQLIAMLEEPLPSLDRDIDCVVSNRLEELSRSMLGKGRYSQGIARRIEMETNRLKALISSRIEGPQERSLGILLAAAYPERIAKQREVGGNRYIMRSGAGAIVSENSILCRHEYLAIAQLDGLGDDSKVHLAEPIREEEIRELYRDEIETVREVRWDWISKSVRSRDMEVLGLLVLAQRASASGDDEALPLIIQAIRERGLKQLSFSADTISLMERINWLQEKGLAAKEFPDLSDAALEEELENWLLPFLPGKRSFAEIDPDLVATALGMRISRALVSQVDMLAPTHCMLPSGRHAPICYNGPRAPSIAGKLQEMFGPGFSPRIGGGKVALTIELLSPAGRPLQVTSDLHSFWTNSYSEVRKEMAGRYPKHPWPLDPQKAQPTRTLKKHQ